MLSGVLLLCLTALIVGQAATRYGAARAAAPAVGLAVLVVLCDVVRQCGGDGTELAAVIAAAVSVSLVVLVCRGERENLRPPPWLLAAGLVFGIAMVPYLTAGHGGFLGPSIDDDSAFHTYWAWSIQTGHVYAGEFQVGYPIGPHSLVAGLATLGRIGTDHAFQALNLSTLILLAVAAYDLLPDARRILRSAGAAAIATTYLISAFYSESSYKEPIAALLVLGVVAELNWLETRPKRTGTLIAPAATLGLLVGAGGLVEGLPGMAWAGGTIAVWLAIRLARGGRPHREILTGLLVGAAAVAASTVGEWGRLGPVPTVGGNVLSYLPTAQAGGIWGGAFPSQSTSLLSEPVLSAVAALGALAGLRSLWRRRADAVCSALIACGLVYVVVRLTESAYLASKALSVLAPMYALLVLSVVLPWVGRAGTRALALPRVALLVAFLAGCIVSTIGALIATPVGVEARASELAAVRQRIRGAPTLMLVPSLFATWDLRGAPVAPELHYGVPAPASVRLAAHELNAHIAREPPGRQNVDLAALAPKFLDQFRFAVTTGGAQPAAPPGWIRQFQTQSYVLWRRVGATGAVIDQGGRRLTCTASTVRAAAAAGDRAELASEQITASGAGWRQTSGGPPAINPYGATALATGTTARQRLDLPPGRWALAMQYQSETPIEVSAGSADFALPADLDVYGPLWPAGVARADGAPLWITVHVRAHRWLPREAMVGQVVARRLDAPQPTVVPASAACGRPVYWTSR